MKPISLTGIKPTGTPHIGNYLGMIKPALELVDQFQSLYFIADYHALTVMHDRKSLLHLSHVVAATWLALGLDPDKVIFYRQSDIPEIFELTWVLECFTPKGLLNRAHAYKALVDSNEQIGNNPDDGINGGVYNYPVLMAADILLFGTQVVPVGLDQKQHIEVTRDVAAAFNRTYGDVLVLPEALTKPNVMTVPGLDGRKMSKSYGNTINLLDNPNNLRKQVMHIITDSKTPQEPKNPDECNVFAIYKHFASEEAIQRTRKRYVEGGLSYGEIKQELFMLLDENFQEARRKYNEYMQDVTHVDQILCEGAAKAHAIAAPMMQKVRDVIGIQMRVSA